MGDGIHAENIGVWAEIKQTFTGFSQAIQRCKHVSMLPDCGVRNYFKMSIRAWLLFSAGGRDGVTLASRPH